VEEVNAMLGLPTTAVEEYDESNTDLDEEWKGISDPEPPPVDHEAEYVDEEKYTTVTVETLDVSKEGLSRAQHDKDEQSSDEEDGQTPTVPNGDTSSRKQKRPWMKEKPKDGVKKRKKKRNFRYEGKTERKEARAKQKSRNSKQARERRAGGS
jgi:ribosomal RNA-processing protein 17